MPRTDEETLPEDASLTIDRFCALEDISRFTFYKMRRAGHGPEELRIPGTEIVRITKDAHARWRASLQERQETKAAKLENDRRVAQRVAAGKSAAKRAAEGKSRAVRTKRGERAA